MNYNVIEANKDQVDKLYHKHMIKLFSMFDHDSYDKDGYVTIYTLTGKKIEYVIRNNEPCFVEFTGFGNIRYDIAYPKEMNLAMYNKLKKWGDKISKNFWKGSQI